MIKKFLLTIFVFIFCLTAYVFYKIPSEATLKGCFTTTMYEVDICPGSKNYVKINQISPYLKKAVITTEDSLFYQHDGFDWDSIKHSVETNLEKKKYARGGSTITQQLAKNLFLTRNKSLFRKFLEALITRKIEKTLKKDEILEKYFNVVQFGKNIFGVKQAAQAYFNKSPANLSLNEGAFLAFLLPSPEKYSISFRRKELTKYAHKRMKTILFMMVKSKKISEGEYESALSTLSYFPSNPPPEEVVADEESSESDSVTNEDSKTTDEVIKDFKEDMENDNYEEEN